MQTGFQKNLLNTDKSRKFGRKQARWVSFEQALDLSGKKQLFRLKSLCIYI